MAALVQQTRTALLPAFRFNFGRALLAQSSIASFFALRRPEFGSTLGSISLNPLPSWLDLFPPFLLAVPKKKTSHSRKAMRSANKGLKDKKNIVNCPACGSPKLAHHLCPACYTFLNRRWKTNAKQDSESGTFAGVPDLS